MLSIYMHASQGALLRVSLLYFVFNPRFCLSDRFRALRLVFKQSKPIELETAQRFFQGRGGKSSSAFAKENVKFIHIMLQRLFMCGLKCYALLPHIEPTFNSLCRDLLVLLR